MYTYQFPLYTGTLTNNNLDLQSLVKVGNLKWVFEDIAKKITTTGDLFDNSGNITTLGRKYELDVPSLYSNVKYNGNPSINYNTDNVTRYNVKTEVSVSTRYFIYNPITNIYANLGTYDHVSRTNAGLVSYLYDGTSGNRLSSLYHPFCLTMGDNRYCYSFIKYENGQITQYVQNSIQIGIGTSLSSSIWASTTGTDTQTLSGLNRFLGDYDPSNTDPYIGGGGSSGGGGGTGDFDNTSDTIGLPSLPSLSGLNTGFFTAFVPSASQMQSVSNYLWNNAITDILDPNTGLGEKVDALKKIVANPYDAIMGCSIIPVTPPTAGSKELKMYGLLETGISLPYASSRWVQVDCGTLNIHEFWGGYLDYSPYTKTTSLYLPYIGTVSIDIDLIMAKALRVVYYVDILSGICVAFILVDGSVKFHYQGQCATQIPITNADYSSVISSGIGLIGNVAQVVGNAVALGSTPASVVGLAGAVAGASQSANSIASNVMGAKPDIRSGGAIGSSAGILSVQRPYLIIERPKQSVPAYQNHFTGYPSNITAKVSDLTGYTEFETINLDGLFLTDSEKKELEDILKGGVYL